MASIIFGLAALSLGLWGLSAWWWSVTEVLRGIVPILLIILGPIALGAGISRLRERGEMERDATDTPPYAPAMDDSTITVEDLGR